MVGVAIPEREVNGRRIRVEADDNAHVLLDFGDARFAVVTTGFTMQRYRSPAIEVYGSEGTVQLLGDDWAPEGWELWRNGDGAWRIFPESDPHWRGPRPHLVECVEAGRPTVTRPEHAYHALEVMLAAQAAGHDGVARSIESGFPDPVYDSEWGPRRGATGARPPEPRWAIGRRRDRRSTRPRRSAKGTPCTTSGVTRRRDSSRTGSTSRPS